MASITVVKPATDSDVAAVLDRDTLREEMLKPVAPAHRRHNLMYFSTPEASRLKTSVPQHVLLYYKYTSVTDVEAECDWQRQLCVMLGLIGRIRVSSEGINGTLSGSLDNANGYIESMELSELWKGIDWKRSETDTYVFPDLVVKPVKELVSSGRFHSIDLADGGSHLTPEAFHAILEKYLRKGGDKDTTESDNMILIDVRNYYEYDVGRFEGAVDPKTRTFSDFPDWCVRNIDELKKKKIMMYCTGGIRCEKASAYLKTIGCTDVNQLSGGIHRYLESYPDGGFFKGKNFVFDQRGTVASGDSTVVGRCSACSSPWDEFSGDVTCAVCHDLVLCCKPCRDTAADNFYCASHEALRDIYVNDIGCYNNYDLLKQQRSLSTLLESNVMEGKNRRRTLRNRIRAIEEMLLRRNDQ